MVFNQEDVILLEAIDIRYQNIAFENQVVGQFLFILHVRVVELAASMVALPLFSETRSESHISEM